MAFSISPWNIIRSMKAVDDWQAIINANIVGLARTGYKSADVFYNGGGVSYILKPPGLNAEAKQIAEQILNAGHTKINFAQGQLVQSWDWTHLGIQGDGFITTSSVLGNPDPDLDIQYTRDGEFHIDSDGFLRTKEGLYVLDGTYIPGSSTNSSTAIPPWIGSIFDSWFSREEIVVENTSTETLTRDGIVEVEFDAQKLINTGQILDPTNLNDVRIGYYQDPPGNPAGWTELPREILPGTGGTAATVLRFRLQDDVAVGQVLTDKYFIYYQGPTTAPVAATGNQAIGVIDPSGELDDFGGVFAPATDPAGIQSVEDWENEVGVETWRAGLQDSPSDTWLGAKAGNITYTKDGQTGYSISTTTSGTVSVNNHSSITAEEVYRKWDGTNWIFVDALGNEIMMQAIDGTNFGGTVDPNYDLTLNRSDLIAATEIGLDPALTKWEVFRPSEIIAAGWSLPDLSGQGGTVAHSTSPAPDGGWNGANYVYNSEVTFGDSNFDANDSVWAGGGSSGSSGVTDDFSSSTNWDTLYGSLAITSGEYRNTFVAPNTQNDSMAYLNTGEYYDFTLTTQFNMLSAGSSPADYAAIQIRKAEQDDDITESGYTIRMRRNGNMDLFKAGVGTVDTAAFSSFNATDKLVRIEANGNNIKVFVDGTLEIDYTDAASTYMGGHIGLKTANTGSDGTPVFDASYDYSTDPFGSSLNLVSGNFRWDSTNQDVRNLALGNSLDLDSANTEFATAADSASLDISGNFVTMEAWVYPNSVSGEMQVMNKESSYELAIRSGKLQMAVETSDPGAWFWTSNTGTDVPLNQWSHVAGVYDATVNEMRLYVNGVLQHTEANHSGGTITPQSSVLSIGSRPGGSYFDGQIDEVRISDTVRYTADFTPTTSQFTSDANTVALYRFNEANGTGLGGTSVDSSGNGNTLTLSTAGSGTPTIVSANPSPVTGSFLTGSMATYTPSTYADFALETDVTFLETSGNTSDWAGIQFRKTNATDNYNVSGYMVYVRENGDVDLYKAGAGVIATGTTGGTFAPDETRKIRIQADGAQIKVFADGVNVIDYTDASPILTNGHISYRTNASRWAYDNLTIGDYPPVTSNLDTTQWKFDNFSLGDSSPDNDFQYTLLRLPIEVSAEGVTRDTLGALNEAINMSGFVDHDVSVFLRQADGTLVSLYEDDTYNNNLWTANGLDPYDLLQVGTNWIEVYASHEVVSPPNVPPYSENFTGATGTLNAYDPNWNVGSSGNWSFADASTLSQVPDSFGTIINQTVNQGGSGSAGAAIFRGDPNWDDYAFESTFGVTGADNDMLRTWVRVSGADASGPTDGYFFFINGNGMNENGSRFCVFTTATNGQVGFAKMVNGVVTVLASSTIPSAGGATVITNNAASWLAAGNNYLPGGSNINYWRLRMEVEGNNIKVYSTNKNYNPADSNASDPTNGTLLFDINDNTFGTGYFALENISQTAWYDGIDFEASANRKTGVRIDTGTSSQRGIQSIDAFETLSRYYTDGTNVYDRFGNPNQALTDASSATLEGAATGDNRYRTSNADGSLNGNADNDGLRDYDPGAALQVSSLLDIPIYDTRLVQFTANPGGESRISTDGDLINVGNVAPVDLIGYDGSNTWNEYEAEFDWGYSVAGAGGDIYAYMRHLDNNNWLRLRHTEGAGLVLEKSVAGVVSQLTTVPAYSITNPVSDGDRLTFRVQGRNVKVYSGLSQLINYTDTSASPILTGRFAVGNTRSAWYDDLEIRPLPLVRFDTWIEGFMQPTGPDDILNQMKFATFADNQGLQYDPIWGGTYFKPTGMSGDPIIKTPGQDGAGDLYVYKLEASNVDAGQQIARLAAANDVFETLSKQFLVYLDTLDSTLRLFK